MLASKINARLAVDAFAVLLMQVALPKPEQDATGALGALYAEELGLVLEVAPEDEEQIRAAYAARGLSAVAVGSVNTGRAVSISVGGEPTISGAPRQ